MRRFSLVLPALFALVMASACRPKYPKCDNDKDCHQNEHCVNGQCQQCRSDEDCPGGKCNSGRCEKPTSGGPNACTDDAQCPAGQSCIDGKCRPCKSDDECGEGGKCNAGRCARAAALPAPPKCSLETVYFDFNEYALTTEATAAVDRDAECIKQSTRPLTLTGHTDSRGTEEYNLALSDKRAQAVRDRLKRVGVTNDMKTVARGEMDSTGKNEASWAKDRRVDVSW
jgi:peptidoglycan-associated lipoprotein